MAKLTDKKQPVDAGYSFKAVKALFHEAKERAVHTIRKKNLSLLWNALESMRGSGCMDWSLANVGRHSEKLGGPKTQSLRNAQGEGFRVLISAYSEIATASLPKPDATKIDTAIEAVIDPVAKGVLKAFAAEAKKLKHENDMLRKSFKRLSLGPSPCEPQTTSKRSCDTVEVILASSALRKSDMALFRRALSPERLAERGLRILEDGSLVDETGFALFPAGFVHALNAFLES